MINIHVKTKNLELTNKISSIITEKVNLLEKFIPFKKDREILAEVEVGKENKHHKKGEDLYRAEINLSLGRRMLRTVSLQSDIITAIDDAKNQMSLRLSSNYSRAKDLMIRGARKAKDVLKFRSSKK